jgi:hypothetical protein
MPRSATLTKIFGRFLEERNDDSEQAREDPRELALFEQAVHLYQAIGDVRGEAEALFWVGCCHQVVRRRLEESSGLRREIGFLPGIASNMVGLIYIAAGQGRHDDALALLDQAEAIAQASGAHGIMRQVEEARAAVTR